MRTQTREQGIEQRIGLSIEPLRLQDPFGDSLKRDRCGEGFDFDFDFESIFNKTAEMVKAPHVQIPEIV